MIAKFNKYVIGVPDKGEKVSVESILEEMLVRIFHNWQKIWNHEFKKCYEAPKNKLNIYKQNDIPAYSITT